MYSITVTNDPVFRQQKYKNRSAIILNMRTVFRAVSYQKHSALSVKADRLAAQNTKSKFSLFSLHPEFEVFAVKDVLHNDSFLRFEQAAVSV